MGQKQDYRSLALDYILRYAERQFGIAPGDFIEWLTEDFARKSNKTIRRYLKGESPMKSWTFQEFWKIIYNNIQGHLENEGLWKKTTPNAAKIWAEEKERVEALCALFFLCSDTSIREADFTEETQWHIEVEASGKKKLLEGIRPIFEALDQVAAYSLQRNFPALSSVTSEDVEFWSHVLDMTETEKAEQKKEMRGRTTVDAGTMLDCLQSEEVRCWVDLKNADYKDTVRKTTMDNWKQFSEKFMALSLLQCSVTASFLLVSLQPVSSGPILSKQGKIEAMLPSGEDIDLLLLFKYCLAPEERGWFLPNE